MKRTARREESTGENSAVGTNDAETQAALDDLASRFKLNDITAHPKDTKTSPHTGAATDIEIPAEQSEIKEADSSDKLAKAAAERKMSRIKRRLPAEYVWQSATDTSGRLVVLFAFLIAIIAAATVYVMIFWR
ncbi:MAG TPA: hypothetical protein VNA17_09895 [Pyrinomonadaceae bacterium]|nr:hypothetical protein [Pyrinomonadaceae bacterium]